MAATDFEVRRMEHRIRVLEREVDVLTDAVRALARAMSGSPGAGTNALEVMRAGQSVQDRLLDLRSARLG